MPTVRYLVSVVFKMTVDSCAVLWSHPGGMMEVSRAGAMRPHDSFRNSAQELTGAMRFPFEN